MKNHSIKTRDHSQTTALNDIEMLELALEYSQYHPRFDSTFIDSLEEYYAKHGSLSPGQRQALKNTIRGYKMEEWGEENL